MATERGHGGPAAHLEMLRQITTAMVVGRDVAEVLGAITSALVTIAEAALARIWLCTSAAECRTCRRISMRNSMPSLPAEPHLALHLTASAGLYSHVDGALHRIELGDRKVGEIATTQRPIWSNDVASDPRVPDKAWVREHKLRSFAGYPLVFRGELVGVLGIFSRHTFDSEHFRSLEVFAAQAATAIKTAQLFSEVERLKDRLLVENRYLQEEIRSEGGFAEIVGVSPGIQQVLRDVRLAGPTDAPVLLSGETGTGKELVARALHALSPRRERAMIRVNCGAIPAALVESELFGHERGAFTGAVARRVGRFELADKSTLFLDEIGELTLDGQVKLLRVLQEHEFERVGGTRTISVDVRPIAATNRDLAVEIVNHRFREDLFYRLNVLPIRVPPLRERVEDLPLLVTHFLRHFQRKLAKPLRGVAKESMDRLVSYPWPGNIRELQNVMERACILAPGTVVHVPDALGIAANAQPDVDVDRIATLEEAERAAIRRALDATAWRISGRKGAAALLAVNPSTLRSRMTQLGIRRPLS